MILQTLFSGGVSKVIDSAANFVDIVHTSEEERTKGDTDFFKAGTDRLIVQQQGALAQTEINKIEAAHDSIVVAGWRPALGWVCVAAFAYQFLIYELLTWGMAIWVPEITPPPNIDSEDLFELILAMLGVVGYRTYEKKHGLASKNPGKLSLKNG